MMYTTMKRLTENANARLASGEWTKEQYDAYRASQEKKLETFYGNGGLTEHQYDELVDLWT